MDLLPYLKLVAERKASDLYLTTRAPIKIRHEGKVLSVGKQELTAEMVQAAADALMTEDQREFYASNLECDFAIEPEGVGRFRVNVFSQRGTPAMAMRYIPTDVPRFETLALPDVLKELIMRRRGLLLMVGPTGSGKTTTLASLIRYRSHLRTGHILTIEDPIEFSHPNARSIINQREIGQDTHSYMNALRSAVRETPDVILIGEIRDRDTLESAIQLAGTGHLTISTLHANNASQALERILNLFPDQQQHKLLMDLSVNLRAIVSQRLVLAKDERRVAAVEVMLNTPYIAELIVKGDVDGIKQALSNGGETGMQSFDTALHQLYQQGKISLDEALSHADSRANLEAKISFG
ncbi:MAG TPA: PilT/PilU family type 4a pilus ATPase [Gammaproteobacteria bacterium]|nr:PilT/PilU family type 4a pilus ATPase [Gammaproteobacteria bacterium]